MSRRRKKGSSLVMVIFVTAIILMTATTMLSLVTTDYKSRLNESEQLKNLYYADSGLELINNIIIKESEAAVLCANNLTNSQIETIVKDVGQLDKESYDKANNYFKDAFIKTLTTETLKYEDGLSSIIRDDSGSNDYDKYEKSNNLLYSILNLSYMKFKYEKNTDEYKNNFMKPTKLFSSEEYFEKTSISEEEANKKILKINVESMKLTGVTTLPGGTKDYTNAAIEIVVKSTFKDDVNKKSSNTLSNSKTIRTKFTLKIPDYELTYSGDVKTLQLYNYNFLRAITCDGDLKVTGNGSNTSVSITGDIWVKGNENNSLIQNKYNSGVLVSGAELNIDGTINTFGSVSQYKDSTIQAISGKTLNINALNVYQGPIGGSDNIDLSKNNKLNATQVITSNDLTYNSNSSLMKINNYYGVSDKKEDMNNINFDEALRKSSSIIVNKSPNEKSSENTIEISENTIEINNAYVNGVSYINLSNKDENLQYDENNKDMYQTGESVSVKGNYNAYTDVIPGYEDKVVIKSYGDYDLIDSINGENNVEAKKNYFEKYYELYKDKLDNGGIKIENLYSVGAGVGTQSNIDTSQEEIDKKISDMKKLYAKEVLLMGKNEDNKESIFNEGKLLYSVKGGSDRESLIDYGKLPDVVVSTVNRDIISTSKIYDFVYSGLTNTVIIDTEKISIQGRDNTKEQVQYGKGYKAVIVTKGDVVINGSNDPNNPLEFDGTIVAGGNVTINGYVNFVYNNDSKECVQITIANALEGNEEENKEEKEETYYNSLKEVFKNDALLVGEKQQISTEIKPNDNGTYSGFNSSSYLKQGLWSLVKEN